MTFAGREHGKPGHGEAGQLRVESGVFASCMQLSTQQKGQSSRDERGELKN